MVHVHGDSRRDPSRAVGGDRRSGEALDANALAHDAVGQNPFAAKNVQFLRRQRRQVSSAGRRAAPTGAEHVFGTPSAAARSLRMRQRQRIVLQALERLDNKDTLEQGVRLLQDILSGLQDVADVTWFLRTVFDERQPLTMPKSRREQFLLLPAVVHRYCAVAPAATSSDSQEVALRAIVGAMRNRVLPFVIAALRSNGGPDVPDTVVEALSQILEFPLTAVEADDCETDVFQELWPLVSKSLFDALVLGSGSDVVVKRRCVQVLVGLTPVLLGKAREYKHEGLMDLADRFAALLIKCLAVNPGLEVGLLSCLSQIANVHGRSIAPHFRPLVERCVGHLLDTPSTAPDYGQLSTLAQTVARAESPTHGVLTRELALVCCCLLQHLARRVFPHVHAELVPRLRQELVPAVEMALSRENLNAQRLTRGNEVLRQAIADAFQAWNDLGADSVRRSDESVKGAVRHRPVSCGRQRKSAPRHLNHDRAVAEPPGAPAVLENSPVRQSIRSTSPPGRGRRVQPTSGPTTQDVAPEWDRHGQSPGPSRRQSPNLHPEVDVQACSRTIEQGRMSASAPSLDVQQHRAAENTAAMDIGQQSVVQEHVEERPAFADVARAVGAAQAAAKQLRMQRQSGAGSIGKSAVVVADGEAQTVVAKSTADAATVMEIATATQTEGSVDKVDVATTADISERVQHDGTSQQGAGSLPPVPGAGPLPPVEMPKSPPPSASKGPPVIEQRETEPLSWCLPADGEAPALAAVRRHFASGHADAAFQTLFRFGNEQTLRIILQQFPPTSTWQQLPEAEAKYFVHLLARLLCKDPLSKPAWDSCVWLDALLTLSGGADLLSMEDLESLRGALFSLSGMKGQPGHCAATVYSRLFHDKI